MKQLGLIIICSVVFSLHSLSAQNSQILTESYEVLTDGMTDYWDPSEEELFRIFKKKYWNAKRINHYHEAVNMVLLVRLRRSHPKIAAYEKAGRTKAANNLRKFIRGNNEAYVKIIKESYPGEYYFYYAEEAEEVFQGNSLRNLYSDFDTRAPDISIAEIAYVLSDQRITINKIALNLFIYDKSNVLKRVSKKDIHVSQSLFSSKYSAEKTATKFIGLVNPR